MTDKKEKHSIQALDASETVQKDSLYIEGLRQNNLKNISLKIPHDKITAIVGLSGSGKSSLAFDTLFAEGRWRFMESLSTYTRLFLERMDRPDLDKIKNIRPAIAIEQKNPVRTSRSTVGTVTEANDYLRLLFARIGKTLCPSCKKEITQSSPTEAASKLAEGHAGEKALIGFTVPVERENIRLALDGLVKKGFIRIKAGGRVFDISAEDPSQFIKGSIDVVTDRVVIKKDSLSRLAASLETSFREGGDSAWVEFETGAIERFSRLLRCEDCGITAEKPTPLLFSFNHPVGACAECKGFGNILKYDEDKVVPDKSLTINQGAIEPWTKPAYKWWFNELKKHSKKYGFDLDRKYSQLAKEEKKILFDGTEDFDGIDGFFEYLETKKYKLHVRVFVSRYKAQFLCPSCNGKRLKEKSLLTVVGKKNIAEVSRMTISEALRFVTSLELGRFEREVAKEALKQLALKLEFMETTGLGYITLDRLTRTLSGGEAQRVQLSNQLGSALSGVLYILDEPSIGLHPRDVSTLIGQIKKLTARKNTVCVVEHDPSVIKASDYIVELGPGSGEAGGRVVHAGNTDEFLSSANTLTAQYLRGIKKINVPTWRRKGNNKRITIKGASGNNLKNIDVSIPLHTFTCVTGVSGSGKSTLITDTLYAALAARFEPGSGKPLPYASLEGANHIGGVRLINQEPIGKTPRSNPVTYIGVFDEIRHLFSNLRSAKKEGLTPGNFSFNVPGGRCEPCKGEGVVKLEMYFMPDMYITCASCNGKRYSSAALDVKCGGKNIYDALNMTFDEAYVFFSNSREITKKVLVLKDVGLGYLRLGQSGLTLSGGEAQRLKIARELSASSKDQDFLYILDEPTTGLHSEDIKKLLYVLGRLVDSGNTVVVVEHNLDCVKTADYVIDLGPEGGEGGGMVIAEGPPEKIARCKESHTGRYLKEALKDG
ncbi:MAG: excinuclease ABC subunit UvrA [Thermodesulfobacteriota bacterium]